MESKGADEAMADLAEEVLKKHNEAMFQRLDHWLLQLTESMKMPSAFRPRGESSLGITAFSLAVPEASPCLSSVVSPTSPMDFETLSDRFERCQSPEELESRQESRERSERPRATLGRMDSAAEDEARLKGERMQLHFQEIEKAVAEKKQEQEAELDTGLRATSSRWASWLLDTQTAHIFFGLVVVSNSIFLGVQLEYYANTKDYSSSADLFMSLHLVYAVLFTVEVCLHLLAEGIVHYLWSEDWAWNWLDGFVVTSSWVELTIDLLSGGGSSGRANSNLRALRLLRVGRLFRVVRIIRVVKFFRSLRTLVHSLVGTLRSLFWALLLLFLIIYIFGILFTDTVVDHLIEQESVFESLTQKEKDYLLSLDDYFGSLYRSTITLFQTISDGVTWNAPADALTSIGDMGLFWVQLYHFYIAFCSFAVLNVMTGVFCNSAIKAAESDHEMVVQSLVQTRQELRDQVSLLFYQIDERGHGQISFTDFEKLFGDEGVKAFFEALQIGAVDAWTLFTTLDKDGDHTISVDEFTERCMQLHGPAKSADLYAIRQLTVNLNKQLQQMEDRQKKMEIFLTSPSNLALREELSQFSHTFWHV